ncbi:MAG TPA: phosphoribosylformylglycinamidine synthase subunit PurS [Phycisphaerales bacterium]
MSTTPSAAGTARTPIEVHHAQNQPDASVRVHRVEVRPRTDSLDARGHSVAKSAKGLGLAVGSVRSARVYLIEAALTSDELDRVARSLLADPVTENSTVGASPAAGPLVEVHPLPGVMDPAAQSVELGIRDLLRWPKDRALAVSTGSRYDLEGCNKSEAELLARRLLFNPAIQAAHFTPFVPASLPKGHAYTPKLRHIAIRDLNDDQLMKMSREAHLFLSLDEMRAVRDEYRTLGRDPTDIELETIAQTWSEHCVHKTLKSRIRYRSGAVEQGGSGAGKDGAAGRHDPLSFHARPGHTILPDGTVEIDNLLKSTVAAATHELIAEGIDWTLSVFKDNSGVIAFDDQFGVCIKVETHNHPSAIEPYGGSATGIGGCIRDVIGTGLGAKPIASTDVFCVATPDVASLPPGCLPPRQTLTEVVRGIRDYGNRMGIPTVSGAVYFDDRHIGNPLVFAGCVGLIPRAFVKGAAKPGDRIIALGGRTGRDGIHGATFSSAEMEHTHADEFSHAVQIGNAIEEKRTLDAILRARDAAGGPLYHGMTDCGAGGFSSAVGEMGGKIGATVQLDRAPLKYAGLSYTEIWISEAQERMVLAVPPKNLAALQKICDEESVELADLGEFGTPGADLVLRYHELEVGRLPMAFLHDGIPTPTREAIWSGAVEQRSSGAATVGRTAPLPLSPTAPLLLRLLSHPNIASKHWIIRQYDHEVQGNTVIKPLGGPLTRGPMDAAVLQPLASHTRGIAISSGLQTGMGHPDNGGDPYLMTLAAIDECVRNLVCVGADPSRIAILDNFCWPSCAEPRNLASLVRAAEACYDGAKAYRTPFVSGKDSLNNQLRYTDEQGNQRVIEIPPTLLITGLAIVGDVTKCVTMDAKQAGNALLIVGRTTSEMGGSHYQQLARSVHASDAAIDPAIPRTDLHLGPKSAHAVAKLMQSGVVRSAHDVSDGGLLCAVAEMLIAGSTPKAPIGASLDLSQVHTDLTAAAFGESPSRYVLEVAASDASRVVAALAADGVWCGRLGELNTSGVLSASSLELRAEVEDLARAWLRPLDW